MKLDRVLALSTAISLVAGFCAPAFAGPTYKSADFSGGLFSVVSTMKNNLTAAGFDSSLFNCSSCANATPVSGHVIFDASSSIPASGYANVFSIGAIPNVANAAIFEIDIDGISLHYGDAGIQGGPAIQYLNGVYHGFFFVDDFSSPNGTALELSIQGGTFDLHRTSDSAALFTGYLDIGGNGLTNIQDFTPPVSVPEPATLALLGIAFAGLGFSCRRKLH